MIVSNGSRYFVIRISSRIITRLTRIFTYKVFILILQCVMISSLVFVFRQSSNDLSSRERLMQISLIMILACIEFVLLLPPFIARWNVLRVQMNLIQLLLIIIFVLLILVIVILIRTGISNQSVILVCIVPLLIYATLMLLFYIYHTCRDSWHCLCSHHRTRLVPGLVEWIECHHSISIYINAYYMILLILALIGIAGLTLASSMFYYNNREVERSNTSHDYIPLYGNDSLPNDRAYDRMEACNWQFEQFTIEDMMLFAALAYQPTDHLQDEIEHFYPYEARQRQSMYIDRDNSQYQTHGYGNVTFFTLVTENAVIVSIRGRVTCQMS
jgi:hypothetical protein